jgi:hypothetical protein
LYFKNYKGKILRLIKKARSKVWNILLY